MKKSNIIMGSRIMGSREKSRQLVIASLSILLGLVALPGPASAGMGQQGQQGQQQQGGQVLPPSARLQGFSLTDMAGKTALFTTSGNKQQFPNTPFQILFYDPNTAALLVPFQGGLKSTGMNAFPVQQGKMFYVPIASVDDSPQIIGIFPTSSSTAARYWFDSSQLGGSESIVVDGNTTPIGASYLVGPITTQPLLDGGGTHIITIGVFLTPLSKGTHTVEIKARFDGALILALGINFLEEDFTYTVTVQ